MFTNYKLSTSIFLKGFFSLPQSVQPQSGVMSGLCAGAGFNDNTVSLSVLTKIEMPFFYSNKMHPCSHQRLVEGEGRQESWISGLINLFGWFRWQLFLCESHLIITSASSPVSSASLKSVFYPGIKQEIRSILSKNLLAATATQNTTEEHFQNLSFSLSLKLKPQADVCCSLCVPMRYVGTTQPSMMVHAGASLLLWNFQSVLHHSQCGTPTIGHDWC